MERAEPAAPPRAYRQDRRRRRSDQIEAGLIVALAALVLFKGVPALAGIALGIAEMMLAVARL